MEKMRANSGNLYMVSGLMNLSGIRIPTQVKYV